MFAYVAIVKDAAGSWKNDLEPVPTPYLQQLETSNDQEDNTRPHTSAAKSDLSPKEHLEQSDQLPSLIINLHLLRQEAKVAWYSIIHDIFILIYNWSWFSGIIMDNSKHISRFYLIS